MGHNNAKPLCVKCNQKIPKWELCRDKTGLSRKPGEAHEGAEGTEGVLMCQQCFLNSKQWDRKDHVKEDIEEQLRETLKAVTELCEEDRRQEEERWQRSEVINEVFYGDGMTSGHNVDKAPQSKEIDAITTNKDVCKAFKRLLSKDNALPAAHVLSEAQDRIITKLTEAALGETEGQDSTLDLRPIIDAVSFTVGQNTTRQRLFSEVLTDIWDTMLKGLQDLHDFHIHDLPPTWRVQRSTQVSVDSDAKLRFLQLLLGALDDIRVREADRSWVDAQRECLRHLLDEMGLTLSMASPLLALTGRGHWSGRQALDLLRSLLIRQPDPSHAVELLELLQRHHVLPSWTSKEETRSEETSAEEHTVIEIIGMIQLEPELKTLNEKLQKHLDIYEKKQLKCLVERNASPDITSQSEQTMHRVYQKLVDENLTNPWTWLDLSIICSVSLALLGNFLVHSGLVGPLVFSVTFCYVLVDFMYVCRISSQREDHRLVPEIYKAVSHFKGWSPSFHQMLTLCEITSSPERRQPWNYVTVVQDDSCLAAMLTALTALGGRRVGVLTESHSHRPLEWEQFYHNLDIKSYNTDSKSFLTFSTTKTVMFGNLETFISNFLQHWPWVDVEEGPAFQPQSLVLGEHLSKNVMEFNHLGQENDDIQNTLKTLVTAAGMSKKQQTEMISLLLFALQTLSHARENRKKKQAHDDKLAELCEQFSTRTISKRDFNHVRLLEIVLRIIHSHQQRVKEGETDNEIEVQCFEHLLKVAEDSCPMEEFRHSLRVLSNLVRLNLWDAVAVLDLFYLLVEKLGETRKGTVKIQQPAKRSFHPLSSTLAVLQLMEVNLVGSSFKDAEERSLEMLLMESRHDSNLFAYLKRSLQKCRERTLDDILSEFRKADVEQKICETIKGIVDYTVCGLDQSTTKHPDRTNISSEDLEHLKLMLLYLCQSVKDTMKLTPRLTQMVSWCLLVLSKPGCLLQLGTGEGKACVVAMFAAYRAIWLKEKVDILSSSPVLSKRDLEQWRPFYHALHLKVDCNTDKDNDQARKKCYEECQVVYGTVECFAADCLRQDFEKKDVRPERGFDCIIVDEVDSLLLDQGVQTTYLSNDMPSLEHLNIILATIWSMVCKYKYILQSDPPIIQGPALPFHKVLFNNIDLEKEQLCELLEEAERETVLPAGFCESMNDSTETLNDKLREVTQDKMLQFFSMAGLPTFSTYTRDENGELKLCNGTREDKVSFLVLDEGYCSTLSSDVDMLCQTVKEAVRNNLHFTTSSQKSNPDTSHEQNISPKTDLKNLCDNAGDMLKKNLPFISTKPVTTEDKTTVSSGTLIPGFLEDLVEQRLGLWVYNSFRALQMQEKEKYIVTPENIYPVDSERTGVVERNKKWGDGLQQFLEMKHGTKLTNMSVITNFLSNVSFFHKYGAKIFGLTGTLGNQYELESLKKLYDGITTIKMPSFMSPKLFEEQGQMFTKDCDWIEKICCVVLEHTCKTHYRAQRAALVICDTIKEAQNIHAALAKRLQASGILKLYTDDSMDSDITEEVRAGDVIVATNLAGRGTDLQISNEVQEAGGLFVALTFLPANDRVEQQAFGRTARQGSPGSAQVLVCSDHLPTPVYDQLKNAQAMTHLQLQDARRARDCIAAQNVSHVLQNDIPRIQKQEELFREYCKIIEEEVKPKSQDRKVMVSMLNEYWGIWYLLKSEDIRQKDLKCLKEDLGKEIRMTYEQLQKKQSPCASIYHYIKFGNKYLFKGRHQKSKKHFSKAIELDSDWAAIAYYYRAYCTYKTFCQKGQTEGAKKDLNKALESVDLYISQCQTILCLLSLSGSDGEDSLCDISKGVKSRVIDCHKEDSEQSPEELSLIDSGEGESAANTLQQQLIAKLQMWAFFRQNIEVTLEEMEKNTGLEECTVFSLMKSPNEAEQTAIYRLHRMGLERIFGTRESLRFCWEGMVVMTLGVMQVFGGLITGDLELSLLSSPFTDKIPELLGSQGIQDIKTGYRAMKTGDLNWESWMSGKLVSVINNFIVLDSLKNLVRKAFDQPEEEQKSITDKVQDCISNVKSITNRSLEECLKQKGQVVTSLIRQFGLREKEQKDVMEICDSLMDSIKKQSLNIMAHSVVASEPLHTFIRDLVIHHELPKTKFTFRKRSNILENSEHRKRLKQVFMELAKRALDCQCKKDKKPLLNLTKNVGSRVEERVQNEGGDITEIMKQEYKVRLNGFAPKELMDIAYDFIQELRRLLKALGEQRNAKDTNTGKEVPEKNLEAFCKELAKAASEELAQSLWELMVQLLGRQQVALTSRSFRRHLEDATRSSIRARPRRGRNMSAKARRLQSMQRQSTIEVMKRLQDNVDCGVYPTQQ